MTRDPIGGQQVKVTRLINAEMENVPYHRKGRPINFALGRGME